MFFQTPKDKTRDAPASIDGSVAPAGIWSPAGSLCRDPGPGCTLGPGPNCLARCVESVSREWGGVRDRRRGTLRCSPGDAGLSGRCRGGRSGGRRGRRTEGKSWIR